MLPGLTGWPPSSCPGPRTCPTRGHEEGDGGKFRRAPGAPHPRQQQAGVPALECHAGTQQDAFRTYSVKWGSAHNRIVSEKSRKQIINTDLNYVCIYTSNSPPKEIRQNGNHGSFTPVVPLRSFHFFFLSHIFPILCNEHAIRFLSEKGDIP